jgi:hypothetical protein
MEAKDLMIGDWVYRIDFNTPVPVKIIGIEIVNYDKMEYVVDVLNKNEHNIHLYLDEIEPIPLTTEILEKNGFVYDSEDKLFEDIYPRISMLYAQYRLVENGGINYGEMSEIKYVHELQHLFKLCGIDKDIEL